MFNIEIERRITKNIGATEKQIFKTGNYVEATIKDLCKFRGRIEKIEDDKFVLRNRLCEIIIYLHNLVDIKPISRSQL